MYSNAHRHMHEGVECDGEKFPGGIVNGAEWYDISGRSDRFHISNYLYLEQKIFHCIH